MKALILAAGFGNRMKPLTSTTHKTLLTIGGRSIIQRIIDALLVYNISDIVIVTGYMADLLQEHIEQNYPEQNVQYIYNERFAQTNNIYSVALAFEQMKIDDDILLIESDLIFDPVILGRLLASPHSNAALVDKYRSGMDGTVVTVDTNVITSVIPPHLQGLDFTFDDKYKTLNIYRFSQEFCATDFKNLLTYYAKTIDDNCYYELILGILIYMQKEVIHAVRLEDELWAEVDDPNDLDIARFIFEPESQRELLEKSFGGYWNYDVIDFCFIRNMYFPSTSVLSELRNNLPELVQNYGSTQKILNRKLAYYLLCNEENLIVLNGASQIYPFLQKFCAAKRMLIPKPTFGEYTRIFHDIETYSDEQGIKWDSVKNTMSNVDGLVVVNPNNPTGSTIPVEEIYQLALEYPEKLMIVDESFIEFANTTSIIPLLEEHPLQNVIVLKSLSKSLGVPGVRLGYVYCCNADIVQDIHAYVPIWNLNSIAENFLEIVLKYRTEIDTSFAKTIEDREAFATELKDLLCVEEVYPGGGNYLLIKLACNHNLAPSLLKYMLSEYSIYARDVSSRFNSTRIHMRVAIRLPSENSYFCRCLQQSILNL